ncbi:DUF6697 family protein [Chitinimonas koreensis]|uniref:DUF6697 family protein n=1 Tax=Chitinimonas koreensis TaxID=356302 RepID=UPI0004175C8E|nr:DUF6697 family protein [Chitinimonas koreensis]QNM94720.1 hypothetical protein H9L41_12285 [Chitinimonas koreensis]
MFELGKDYTREDIHIQCGGNKQAFLPMHKGKVVAACLRPDLNPQAPDVVLCNGGGAARAAGRVLAKQTDPIPVFIRREIDRWRYVGHYAPADSLTAPADCQPYVKGSGFTTGQISRVIKLVRR